MVRSQWANLARMPGLHPYSLSKDILGFVMTTESQYTVNKHSTHTYIMYFLYVYILCTFYV